MKARNSLGKSISLLNDEPPRQPPKGGLLRAMSDSNTPVPVSAYQCEPNPQSPPELLRTESSGSSIRRTPTPPTPCTVDETYGHHTYPTRGAQALEKLPHPSHHQRIISRSYSDDSEWLPSPPASPHPLGVSLMNRDKRDAFEYAGRAPSADSPVSPQQEDIRWATKPDKRRYTWSPPPEPSTEPQRLSLPVRNRDSLGSKRTPQKPLASPTRAQDALPGAQEGARPRRRYACPVGMCAKTFSTSGHASRHAKTHEGRREHVCGECFKRFGRRDNMRQHMTTHAPQHGPDRRSGGGGSKRRKSYGGADGGLPPAPEPSDGRHASGMELLAAAAAAAEVPAVGELTLR